MRPRNSRTTSLTPRQKAILGIARYVTPDHLAAIVNFNLNNRSNLTPSARARLNDVLKAETNRLKVPGGFIDASKAPSAYLLQPVLRMAKYGPMLEALLYGWQEGHLELRERIYQFLVEQKIPVRKSVLSNDVHGELSVEHLEQLVHGFIAENPTYDTTEATLMMGCLCAVCLAVAEAGKEEVLEMDAEKLVQDPSTQEATNVEPEKLVPDEQNVLLTQLASPALWQHLLDPWIALPPNSPEWDAVESFTLALRALADTMLRERQRDRDRFHHKLEFLRSDTNINLNFFQIIPEAWSNVSCAIEEFPLMIAELETLHLALLDYAAIENTPADDVKKRREQRHRLEDLEERIIELTNLLNTRLSKTPVDETQAHNDPAPVLPINLYNADFHPSTASSETVANYFGDTHDVTFGKHDATVEKHEQQIEELLPANDVPSTDRQAQPDFENTHLKEEIEEQDISATGKQSPSIVDPTSDQANNHLDLIVLELESPQNISQDIDASSLIWQLISTDDLTGAYWLAKSLTFASKFCPLPPQTLSACQGARWLDFTTDVLLADSRATEPDYLPQGDGAQILTSLAAALLPALLSPASSFIGWLSVSVDQPALREVVTVIKEFAQLQRPLRSEDLAGAEAPTERENVLHELRRCAAAWLQNARPLHSSLKRERELWERLLKVELTQLLNPIIEDRRTDIAKVRSVLDKLGKRDAISRVLSSVARELKWRKGEDIEGSKREGIVRDILEAVAIAEEWCILVERSQEGSEDWFSRHVDRLSTSLRHWIPVALAELNSLSWGKIDEPQTAAALCVSRTLQHLLHILRQSETPLNVPGETIPASWWLHDQQGRQKTIEEALYRRMLWFPEITLQQDNRTGELVPPDTEELCQLLITRPPTESNLRLSIDGWLSQNDFRFIDLIRSALPDGLDLKDHCDEVRIRARLKLQAERDHVFLIVERALIDGVLIEEDYIGYTTECQSIQPEELLNLAPAFDRLRYIEDRLLDAQQRRIETQQKQWEELSETLEHQFTAAYWEDVRTRVEGALARQDVRVVDEVLDALRETRDTGKELRTNWVDRQPEHILEEFRDAEERINTALAEPNGFRDLLSALNTRDTWSGLAFGSVSPKRLDEARGALEQWRILKQKRPNLLDSKDLNGVVHLLRYLGFTPILDGGGQPILKAEGIDWVHITLHLSSSGLAKPIPNFGDLTRHYNVVCLWSRLGADAISARLQEMRLNTGGLIVFYMGRLEFAPRQKLGQLASRRGFAFAAVDENLLVFLAAQRDTRLPAFLRCSLPFSAPMPYTPDCAGAVPPEMFFGREEMARDLMDRNGSCLVYGGRQLGKTALLKHTERLFDHPEDNAYSWIESISMIGNPPLAHQHPDTLYERLCEQFATRKLISGAIAPTRQGKIKQIRDAMLTQKTASSPRRVIVMLDEADNFLEADRMNNFRIVAELRDLMNQTERRFKIVFAGLHHVQKFQNVPNHWT